MTNPVAGDEQQLRARIEAWRRGKAMTATEIYELAVEMARFILAAPAPPVRAAEPDMAVGLEQRQYDASERASLSGAVPSTEAGLRKLAAFGLACLATVRGDEDYLCKDELDGCDVQDMAEATGVLVPVKVTESCGETCACAEWDDFPLDCYRMPADVKAASHALSPAVPSTNKEKP